MPANEPSSPLEIARNERIYCFHCHSQVKLSEIFYKCPTPDCQNTLLQFPDISKQVFKPGMSGSQLVDALQNATCERDGWRLLPQCSNCEKPLYFSMSMHRSPIVAIAGGKRAGKTCYLGALRKRLSTLERLAVAFHPARGARLVEDIYRNLRWGGRLPAPDSLVDVQMLVPCAIRIGIQGIQGKAANNGIVTYNVAGEAFSPPSGNTFDDTHYVSRIAEHARYVGGRMTSGILLIIDPYACLQIDRERLPKQPSVLHKTPLTSTGSYDNDHAPEEILRMISTYISMNHRTGESGRAPLEIALVLGKLDVFLRDGIDPGISKAAHHYIETDRQAHDGIMESF
ncbi:MAG: hypothetical protein HZA90_18045 [Verrucomicrobia bacterium]|nr:hypothetical protein [Verrucomicrobiota bacterium]